MEQSFDKFRGIDQLYGRVHNHLEHISSLLNNRKAVGEEQNLSDIYSYVKSITGEYYDGQKMIPEYKYIRMAIERAEGNIISKILNVSVEFDLEDTKEKDNFIEELIHKTREYLVLKCWWYSGRVPFEKMNFSEECKNASMYSKGICDKSGITSYLIEIAPGYDKTTIIPFKERPTIVESEFSFT